MSMSDPIADMLTRIRNAQSVEKTIVSMPSSKLKESLAGARPYAEWIERGNGRPDIYEFKLLLADEIGPNLFYASNVTFEQETGGGRAQEIAFSQALSSSIGLVWSSVAGCPTASNAFCAGFPSTALRNSLSTPGVS